MKRRRRRLLRVLGTLGCAGVAGCSAIPGGGTRPRPVPTDTGETPSGASPRSRPTAGTSSARTATGTSGPTDTTESPTPPRTDPEATTPAPPTATPATPPFAFDADVLEPRPTADTPPILRVRIRNTDEQPRSLTAPSWTVPVNPLHSEGGGREMQLIAESAVDSVTFPDTDPGCWKSMFLPSQPAYNGVRIDPGNSLAGEYAILPVAFDPEDIRECWPAGTYRFAHPYWLDSSPVSSPSGTPFGWDLEVRISEFAAISIASSDLSWESA